MKPFADGEMIKECLTAVAVRHSSVRQVFQTSLSGFTIASRIEDLSENIATTLRKRMAKLEYCCLALDESCDISDTAQLAIFLRGIDTKFNIAKELSSLVPMEGTTTGKNLYDELKSVLEKFSILLEKIIGISTDGAPAM